MVHVECEDPHVLATNDGEGGGGPHTQLPADEGGSPVKVPHDVQDEGGGDGQVTHGEVHTAHAHSGAAHVHAPHDEGGGNIGAVDVLPVSGHGEQHDIGEGHVSHDSTQVPHKDIDDQVKDDPGGDDDDDTAKERHNKEDDTTFDDTKNGEVAQTSDNAEAED